MGLDVYATWTSPIRKYGDMINHRLLKAHILGKAPVQTPDETVGEELALHRKHHKIAERNVADWLYARTLADEPAKETRFQAEILISTVRACVFAYSKMAQWPLFREL